MLDDSITAARAAKAIGIVPETLRSWRRKGRGPEGFRIGNRWFYSEAEVKSWIAEQRRTHGAAASGE